MRRLLPPLILAALALAVFWELAFTDHILGRGDTFSYFYPYWAARDAHLLRGELPLWSTELFTGTPLLANPQLGTFYPPNWLTVALPAPDAIRVSVLLHLMWAGLGAYVLGRVRLSRWGAFVMAAAFALGGTIGGHVEQINQLQGLSWLPWLFWLLHHTLTGRGWHWFPLLAMALALQILSGHTQTVFIGGVGMGVYVLAAARQRGLLVLAGASLLALTLATPQIVPTLELIGQGGRSGGLSANAALSFSFSPWIAARGLLPSYDAKLFTEYIAYIGVGGLVLAALGAMQPTRGDFPHRRAWLVVMGAGLALAFGAYNPLNWLLIQLPGFDLFRVPARWLALFTLGAASFAGAGFDAMRGRVLLRWRTVAIIAGGMAALMLASLLSTRAPAADINGPAVPGLFTWAMWGGVLVFTLALMRAPSRWRGLVVPLVALELLAASGVMPYNDLVPPDVWHSQRFTISQLLAETATDANGLTPGGQPPGRLLSITPLEFDPGDKAALSRRYGALGLTALEERYAFVAAKRKESLAPNLALAWGIPTVDGFDGGLLPTRTYNAFTQTGFPAGVEVPGDGRLLDYLALPECRGACIPPEGWLRQADVRYLLTDKVFDVWHEGLYYDTALHTLAGELWPAPPITSTRTSILYQCDAPGCDLPTPAVTLRDEAPVRVARAAISADAHLITADYAPGTVERVQIPDTEGGRVLAVTLADTRLENVFYPLTPPGWERVLSSDIKLYRATTPTTRATLQPASAGTVTFTAYHPTRIALIAETTAPADLVLADAIYPGWRAFINEQPVLIQLVNVNFRSIALPQGTSQVIFVYRPWWLPGIFVFGGFTWVLTCLITLMAWWRYRRDRRR